MEDPRAEEAWYQAHRDEINRGDYDCPCCHYPSVKDFDPENLGNNKDVWAMLLLCLSLFFNQEEEKRSYLSDKLYGDLEEK